MPVQAQVSPGEQILDLGDPNRGAFVSRVADPVITPQPYVTPADFTAQYPIPLDPTEIIAMCEEVTAWQALPEITTGLNGITWRELNSLAFTSGTTAIAFADGECPAEYTHDGTNTTVNHKNIGAKKSISDRDLLHSFTTAGFGVNAINQLVGGVPTGEGVPGGSDTGTFVQEAVADVKEKEVRAQMTLVLNAWDRLLIDGDATTRPLEFDGVENLVTIAGGSHNNDATSASGTYSSITYDRFLAESCAKPTHVWGHGQAVQEMLSGYFQLGFAGSQIVNFANGDRITPGFNFAGFVNTGVGRLAVVADANFTQTAGAVAGTFISQLFGLRMSHNGVPLVFKSTQIPLQMKDLSPGCTAVSFEVWAATSLIVKHACAHSTFLATFSGNIVTTCPTIG